MFQQLLRIVVAMVVVAAAILIPLAILKWLSGRLFKGRSRKARTPLPSEYPYRKAESLLTRCELAFFHQLLAEADGRLLICPKVRLADLFQNVTSDAARNRINQKHVDFVLCCPDTLAPALVIELDDSSHTLPDRQERDVFVNTCLKGAGIPIARERARRSYDPNAIRKLIASALERCSDAPRRRA